MSRPKTAVLANRLWVAKRLVKPQHLHPFRYTVRERVWDDMFGAFVIMDREVCAYREYATKVGFHCGDLEKLRSTFRGFTFYDDRAAPRLPLRGRKLKVRLKLHAEQRAAVRAWLKRGYGIIFAPVRWGKTIAAAAAAFKLGLRTIMMVDKLSLAQQWLDELRKSKHTNLRKIERQLGRPLAGVLAGSIKPDALRKLKHFPPLTFTTFQSIHSLLKRRPKFMRRHRNDFGLVIVDECFVSGTPVLLADGTTKPIEQVVVGDLVWTPGGPRPVSNIMHRRGRILEVVSDDGSKVYCTANHPFATVSGTFVAGGHLDGSQEIIRCCVRQVRETDASRQSQGLPQVLPTRRVPAGKMPVLSSANTTSSTWRACTVLREEPPSLDRWGRSLEQGLNSRDRCSGGSGSSDERGCACAVGTTQHAQSQSNERREGTTEGAARTAACYSGGSCSTLRQSATVRQREIRYPAGTVVPVATAALGLPARVSNSHPSIVGPGIPDVLQGGLRTPPVADRGGDRRQQSSKPAPSGPQEGPTTGEARMVRAAFSDYRLPNGDLVCGTACRARATPISYEADVFNLEVVEIPLYVAGGFLVHNCHHTPAITYAHAISFFNAAHRLGVTGSIKRRDGKHMVMHDIMGPVTGIGTQEQMPVTVYLHFTDVNVRAQTSWTTMISNLCRSLPLTDAVLEQVITDAEQGRYVMVHSERNQHLEDMCARVRRLAPHLNPQFVHQKVKVPVRKQYVRQMERGKIKVLFVGNVFMEGMTIKRADCLHLFPTTTNPEVVKQRTGRVRTFVAGKPRPIVRLWCVGGHGGLFAGRTVHLKYFKEHPHDFHMRTATLAEVVGNTATRKLQQRERRAARTCSQCRRFIRCRTTKHIRAQGSVCSRFKEHQVPAQLKLQWLVHHRHRLNEYGQRMISSFRRQSAKRLSVDQLRILNEVYMDLLNNQQTTKLPSL
jgi:superfamily II DNA or RNA helicase